MPTAAEFKTHTCYSISSKREDRTEEGLRLCVALRHRLISGGAEEVGRSNSPSEPAKAESQSRLYHHQRPPQLHLTAVYTNLRNLLGAKLPLTLQHVGSPQKRQECHKGLLLRPGM
jgi:hypothetical protein